MAVIQDAVESFSSLLSDLPTDEVELVVSTLKNLKEEDVAPPLADFVGSLVGHSYTQADKLKLELESLFRYFERRRELLSGALTAAEVAKLLGTSRQTPHDRMKSQTLLGVLDKGVYRFPWWQFDPEGPDGVIDGLPEVLRVLEVSDFAKLYWFMRPNPFLYGLTPVQALRSEQKERVIQEAARINRA